jgi:hypothetical protein
METTETGHEIWNLERQESLLGRSTGSSSRTSSEVAVQEVVWKKGSIEPADDYIRLYGNGNYRPNHYMTMGFFKNTGIRIPFENVKFISDRISYIA